MKMRLLFALLLLSFTICSVRSQSLTCTAIATNIYITEYLGLGSSTFFTACTSMDNCQLYKTDGDLASTKQITLTAVNPPQPRYLSNLEGSLFFAARDLTGTKRVIWSFNNGTSNITDQPDQPDFLTAVNNRLYFTSIEGGAPRPSVKLSAAPGFSTFASSSAASNIPYFSSCGNNIIFNTDKGLGFSTHISSGLPGSEAIGQTLVGYGINFFSFNGNVYFSASYNGSAPILLRTNCQLSPDAVVVIRDQNTGKPFVNPTGFIIFNNKLYFSSRFTPGKSDLFVMDTSESVSLAATTNPHAGLSPYNILALGSRLYFSGFDFATFNSNLYSLDTTNTLRVIANNINSAFSSAVFGDSIYLTLFQSATGYEIYEITTAAPDSLSLAIDLNPGSQGSNSSNLFSYGNFLLLQANDPSVALYACTKTLPPSTTPPSTTPPSTTPPTTVPPQTTQPSLAPSPTGSGGVVVNNPVSPKKRDQWSTWNIVVSAICGSLIVLSVIVAVLIFLKKK